MWFCYTRLITYGTKKKKKKKKKKLNQNFPDRPSKIVLNSSWRKGLDCSRRRNLDGSRWRGLDGCALEGTRRLVQRSGLDSRAVARTLTEEIFSSPSSKTPSEEECDRGKLAMKIWISGADLGDEGWVGLRDEDLDFRLRRREWVIASDGVGLALRRSEAYRRLLSSTLAIVAGAVGVGREGAADGCRQCRKVPGGGGCGGFFF